MSFRPPRRFEPMEFDPNAPLHALFYRTTTASGGVAELAFRRIKVPPQFAAGEVCDLLLRPHGSILLAVFAPPVLRTVEKLGPIDAQQVHQPAIPMIVRAVQLPDGYSVAVSLRVEGGPIDEPLYRSFDLACRAVDFKLSSGADR